MHGKSWKYQQLLQCLVKGRIASMESPVARMHQELMKPKAGKGDNSLYHYNVVHKFIPMPQAMKILAAKAAVDKAREKLEKISPWNLAKVRNKSDVIEEARNKSAQVHVASLMDICHLKNAELEKKHQKFQGRVVLGDIEKTTQDLTRYFLNKARLRHKSPQKLWMLLQGSQDAQDKLMQFPLTPQVKMDAAGLLKLPRLECPDMWIYHDASGRHLAWSNIEEPT